ncbi:MAG: amidase family protein, partial [Actinomycetota bacterium]
VTPSTPTTAFAAEGPPPREIDGEKIREMHSLCFTYPFNVSGHPAVSVPCGFDSEGLPVGLQFVGRRHSDHVLIGLAATFESLQPWPRIAPAYDR